MPHPGGTVLILTFLQGNSRGDDVDNEVHCIFLFMCLMPRFPWQRGTESAVGTGAGGGKNKSELKDKKKKRKDVEEVEEEDSVLAIVNRKEEKLKEDPEFRFRRKPQPMAKKLQGNTVPFQFILTMSGHRSS